jgi:hypothetical protein
MNIATHTTWIARPREEVFDFFVDFSKASRWRQYVESMGLVDDRPVGVGSRLEIVLELMGERQTIDMQVTAFDRPSLWRHRTNETDFFGHVEYRFDEEGSGTRVTLTMDAKPNSLYGWLAVPLMWLGRGKAYQEQLPQLKRALEGN